MARLVPNTIHPSVRSSAERRMFEALRVARNTDDWVVLHSLAFAQHAEKRRGEIDFLVVCPTGVFAIEVKAGRVARKDGIWIHTDRWGHEHSRRESPFEQAASAMFSIEGELIQALRDTGSRSRPLVGYGVVLPDIRADDVGIGLEQRHVLSCYDDRHEPLSEFISRCATVARTSTRGTHDPLSAQEIASIVRFLRGDFEAIPTVRSQSDEVSSQILRLTDRQLRVLERFDVDPRVVVEGGAGTGKSVLATEAARREARKGRRTALLCYNRLLHATLKAAVSADQSASCLDVLRTSQLLFRVVRDAGREAEWQQAWDAGFEPNSVRSLVEDCLLSNTTPLYDSIVIDEAQDVLSPIMYDTLDCLLVGGMRNGCWRVFMDPVNQAAVYPGCDPDTARRLRADAHVHHLTINCRNTRQVVGFAEAVSQRRLDEAMVDGPAVEPTWYDDDVGPVKKTLQVVRDLVARGASPGRITVLCPRREVVDSFLSARCDVSTISLVDEVAAVAIATGVHEAISCTTVSAFKGLENDVIVLAGLELHGSDWWEAIAYVGMTRARSILVPVLPTSAQSACRARGLI